MSASGVAERAAPPARTRRITSTGARIALVVAVEIAVGVALVRGTMLALAVVVALGVAALIVFAPRMILALALLAPFFSQRIGPAEINMSVTDAYTVVAILAALPFVSLSLPALRKVLLALAGYLAILGVSVLSNPSERAFFELAHRGVLFGGAILIGVAVVSSGQLRTTLRLFVCAATIVGTAAIIEGIENGFNPAYPLGLHKNHAGVLLAGAFLVLVAAPERVAMPTWLARAAQVVLGLGLLATQARSAAIALVVVLVVRMFLPRPADAPRRRRSPALTVMLLALVVAVTAVTGLTVRDRDVGESSEFGAIESRVDVYERAIEIWKAEPILGSGLRFWNDPTLGTGAPHNLVIAELGEAGVVGLAALVGLMGAVLTILWRRRSALGNLGFQELLLRIVQGVAEIFWVAGPFTMGSIFVGIGLGDEPDNGKNQGKDGESDDEQRPEGPGASAVAAAPSR